MTAITWTQLMVYPVLQLIVAFYFLVWINNCHDDFFFIAMS